MSCARECQQALQNYASIITGSLTALAIGIAAFQVVKHLKNYSNPDFQNKIITIIFMAPFYAFTSFLAVLSRDQKGYFALIRDIYEAVLIYAFFNLLASYVAYDHEQKSINYERIYEMLSTKGVRKHPWPMNYIFRRDIILISNVRGEWFFKQCRLYILQYLAIKPITTLLMILDFVAGDAAAFKWFLYFIVFVSVSLSMYYLVLFYSILKEELAYSKPLLKLLSVKMVLFFTFWQDIAIEMMSSRLEHLFTEDDGVSFEALLMDLKCILICFEMVLLSLVTTFAFSYKDFKDTQKKNWLLKKSDGVTDLAKKLMHDVISENFNTAIEDLKELKNPLKDPFKSYKPSAINKEDLLSYVEESETTEQGSGYSSSSTSDKHYHALIHERPFVIPDFMVKDKPNERRESVAIGGNSQFRVQEGGAFY